MTTFRTAQLWTVQGIIRRSDQKEGKDVRLVIVVADGFEEALEFGREALLHEWSSQPMVVARLISVRPATVGDVCVDTDIYIPVEEQR